MFQTTNSMEYREFYRLLTVWFCSIAVVLNLFLLPIALTLTKYALGSFKIIMLVFAATNVAHSALDLLSLPRFYAYPGVMGMFADGVEDKWIGRLSIVFLCALFCAQVFNEFLHFFYRYILLCKPSWIWLLETKNLVMGLIIGLPLYMVLQGCIVSFHFTPIERISWIIDEDVQDSFNSTADRLYGIAFLFWEETEDELKINWSDCIQMVLFLFFNTILIFGMFFCGLKTHWFLKEKSDCMSSSVREMHRTVFRMLVAQTTIPFVVLHIPGIILLSGPAFFVLGRLELDLIMTYVLTCPLIEPFVVVYYLAMRRLRRFLCCKQRGIGSYISDASKVTKPTIQAHSELTQTR